MQKINWKAKNDANDYNATSHLIHHHNRPNVLAEIIPFMYSSTMTKAYTLAQIYTHSQVSVAQQIENS